jgi:hypothetical protein
MPPHPSVELVACLHDGGRAGGLAAAVVDLERRLVDPHADRRRPLVHPHPDGHREPRRRRGHVLRRGGRAAATEPGTRQKKQRGAVVSRTEWHNKPAWQKGRLE